MSENNGAEQARGFQVGKDFYPAVDSMKLGDAPLVRELTGLGWEEFLELLPDEDAPDEQGFDPIVLSALLAVSVQRQNPTWRRDRVVRYVSGLGIEQIESVGPSSDEEEEPGPPEPKAGESSSAPSAGNSHGADTDSDESQTTTGGRVSAIGSA